jgi:hypothetical protein
MSTGNIQKDGDKLQFNADKIAAINIGIEDNPKLKALDEAGFHFVPPSGKWTKGKSCDCAHCQHRMQSSTLLFYNLATRC